MNPFNVCIKEKVLLLKLKLLWFERKKKEIVFMIWRSYVISFFNKISIYYNKNSIYYIIVSCLSESTNGRRVSE